MRTAHCVPKMLTLQPFGKAKDLKRIIIDLGNTQGKLAVYDGTAQLGNVVCCKRDNLAALAQQMCEREGITQGAISSVIAADGVAEALAQHGIEMQRISSRMPLPFTLGFDDGGQLGADRVAAIAATQVKYGAGAKLIVDIGTMITYELITKNDVYLGGTISPGVEARFRSMNLCTSLLPMGKIDDYDSWIGISTPTALAAGVVNGITFEMQGYIYKAQAELEDLDTVVFTGGAASYFARMMKSKVHVEPELVLSGAAFLSAPEGEKHLWQAK